MSTGNARPENGGRVARNNGDWKISEWKMKDKSVGIQKKVVTVTISSKYSTTPSDARWANTAEAI